MCQDICEHTGWKGFKIKPVSHVVSIIGKETTKSKNKSEKYQIKIKKTIMIQTITNRSSTNKKLHPLSQNVQAPNGQGKH